MEARTDKYLLDRKTAAERYSMSVRGLEEMYKQHPDFPVIRVGRKVQIHQKLADDWFAQHVGGKIEME